MATRQERRVLLRNVLKDVSAHGISPRQGIWGTVAATHLVLEQLGGRSPQRGSEAARRAVELYELSLKHNPPEAALACARGCAYCCHSYVTATAPEIFLLARTVRSSDADLAPAIARVRETNAFVGGMGKVERFAMRQPCSMLVANECSAYAGRPLACRAFASFSLPKCEEAFRTGGVDIPTPAINGVLRRACNQALWSGLAAVGLPFTLYELNHALLVALENPDAEQRWLRGEDVFAGVTSDDAGAAVSDPNVQLFLDVVAAAAQGREPPRNPWL
jgi:Fe-S-cluster containining protein